MIFFQVPKGWEVGLRTLEDEFFLFLLKILDWEPLLLGTLGNALTNKEQIQKI
jgi:hypothetical protein